MKFNILETGAFQSALVEFDHGEEFFSEAGAMVRASGNVDVDVSTRSRGKSGIMGGIKRLFSGKGAFFIEASGSGEIFFGAYGAVVEKELDGELIVDNGHVLAWENTLDWSLKGAGGLKSTLFSGEGLVMRFSGRGRIWLQTRHLAGTAGWITPFLRA